MPEDASSPEQQKMTRKDFLKLASLGTAAGGAVLVASKTKPIVEAFNRLSFNPDFLLEGKPISDSDIDIVRSNLNGMDILIGFEDAETWNKSVEQSLTTLKDMSSLCRTLDPESKEFRLTTRDLHELSTTFWLLLQIKNDFKGKGEELQSLVKEKQISEHIFTHYGSKLTTEWMYDTITTQVGNPGRETLVDYLLTTPKFLGAYGSYFFDWFLSPEYRQSMIEELGKAEGAKITEIGGDINENDKARILHQLETLRLSKVARKLSFFKSEWVFGSHSYGYVKLGLTEQELNNLFSGKQEWQAFQLHEIGHIVWGLVKLIPDLRERLKFRTQLHGLLESFMPTRDLNAYLHPQGKFRSISNGEQFLNNALNEASITQYSSGYFLFDLQHEGRQLLKTLQTKSALAEVIITNAQVIDGMTDAKVIAERELSPLEDELVKRSKQILTEVDKSERVAETTSLLGVQSVGNPRRLLQVGIPLAFLDMIQNNRVEVINLALMSSPRYTKDYIERLIDGYLLATQESLESMAGEELFCELFQATLRRNNTEVQNQMEDDRLEQFQQLINKTLDALIKHKLARREVSKTVV